MIKFNMYNVQKDGKKVKVMYSFRKEGELLSMKEECFVIYAKEYGEGLKEIFGSEVKNNTDSMFDYFEKDRIYITRSNPLFPEVEKAYKKLTISRNNRMEKRFSR